MKIMNRFTVSRQQIDYARIKNFVSCRETSGTSVALENGATMDDASLAFITNGVQFVTNTGATSKALTGGSWDVLNAVDFVILVLQRFTGNIYNCQIGNLPPLAAECDLHFGGSTSWSAGINGDVGLSGVDEWISPAVDRDLIIRQAWKCNYGVDFDVSMTGEGVGVSFQKAVAIPSGATWDDIGGNFDFSNQFYTVFSGGATWDLYGIVMVEFPNGFPLDINERINYTFDQWESGNKIHFPVYVDE